MDCNLGLTPLNKPPVGVCAGEAATVRLTSVATDAVATLIAV